MDTYVLDFDAFLQRISYIGYQVLQSMPFLSLSNNANDILSSTIEKALLLCDFVNTSGSFYTHFWFWFVFFFFETGSHLVTQARHRHMTIVTLLSGLSRCWPRLQAHVTTLGFLLSLLIFLTWFCGHLCFYSGYNHSLIKNEILLGLVTHACHSSTQKAKPRGLWVWGQLELLVQM